MSAGFSQNQRSTGGLRQPLQQTKTALRQFCNPLKFRRGACEDRETRARAKRKRDSAQPQEIGRSLKRKAEQAGWFPCRHWQLREPPRPRFRSGTPPNLGGELHVIDSFTPSVHFAAGSPIASK